VVAPERAEAARALMLELFPEGFEERDAAGEERLWAAFGRVASEHVEPGWEERWRTFHRAARVGPLWIGPPWERPDGGLAVTIHPGRAFGTGAHPTTRLCLELLLELQPASLLDVGCGSGVIAVAAARLGFGPIVALDHDPAAVEAAKRNAEANGVALDTRLRDVLVDELPAAAVAVANITGEVVRRLAPRLGSAFLIGSGYLESGDSTLPGFHHLQRRTAEGWAADLFRREE
jgi:ribosomal protein L11 methyltransferase